MFKHMYQISPKHFKIIRCNLQMFRAYLIHMFKHMYQISPKHL